MTGGGGGGNLTGETQCCGWATDAKQNNYSFPLLHIQTRSRTPQERLHMQHRHNLSPFAILTDILNYYAYAKKCFHVITYNQNQSFRIIVLN